MIHFLDSEFTALNSWLRTKNYSKLFILCDENTNEQCLPIFLSNLETSLEYEIIEIEAGEENKSVAIASQIWELLNDMNADRNALLINLGGGVITDLGGFVASTFKRGISFIHVPTTLLAMCDASVGGKTGVDLNFIKNAVGTFALPEEVFVYTQFLETLPFEELRCGFAEMLKHGLIADHSLWQKLSQLDELTVENIAPYLQRSIQIKEEVVEKDFREENIRKTLNFGHTLGHALESLYLEKGQDLKHGEAVAFGMVCETYISHRAGLLPENETMEVIVALKKFFPKLETDIFSEKDFIRMLIKDKKNENGKVLFVLLDEIGKASYNKEVSYENLVSALQFYREL